MNTLKDLGRACIHTITTKPWSLAQCIEGYQKAGVNAITVWRNAFDGIGAREAGRMLRAAGMRVTSLCRGGFFPSVDAAKRAEAVQDNLKAIEEAHELGAPLIVLVCGADPGQPLEVSRRQIAEGIQAALPAANAAGVRLGIEPLHPMYACDRSAVNTLGQANDMAEAINDPMLGVTVDTYHVWWDPALEREIKRAGRRIFSYHVCDWRTPVGDVLNDRRLMGTGCIPLRQIRGWVEQAGFTGDIEVEIFSNEYWAQDQTDFVRRITGAYLEHC